MEQFSIFDYLYPKFQIEKPIRLIELFAGVGTFAMALRDLGADFKIHRAVEIDKYAIASYNAIHGTDFPTIDIKTVKGGDLGIEDINHFTYIMTYSFPCLPGFIACRKEKRNGQELRNKIRTVMGSRKAFK